MARTRQSRTRQSRPRPKLNFSLALAGGALMEEQLELERLNPLISNGDVLRCVIPFARGDGYLFVAGTSRHWHQAWGEELRHTTFKAAAETVKRVEWAMAAPLKDPHALALSVEAAGCGRLDVLKEVFALGMDESEVYVVAAERGHLDVVQWIRKQAPLSVLGTWACAAAAWGGHLDVLRWCRANGFPWDEDICMWAARGGNLELLQWCISNGSPLDHRNCLLGIGAGGNLEMATWAEAEEFDFEETIMCLSAAAEGHLEMLKWAREVGIEWKCYNYTVLAAAYGGHLEVLKWCSANGCEWTGKEATAAASQGHLELLQWVTANGCPWGWGTMATAAGMRFPTMSISLVRPPWLFQGYDIDPVEKYDPRGGHLEVVKWCRSNGCPWDERTCTSAALRGHLDILKWLRANGCPWGRQIIRYCQEEGNEAALEWCTANGGTGTSEG